MQLIWDIACQISVSEGNYHSSCSENKLYNTSGQGFIRQEQIWIRFAGIVRKYKIWLSRHRSEVIANSTDHFHNEWNTNFKEVKNTKVETNLFSNNHLESLFSIDTINYIRLGHSLFFLRNFVLGWYFKTFSEMKENRFEIGSFAENEICLLLDTDENWHFVRTQ